MAVKAKSLRRRAYEQLFKLLGDRGLDAFYAHRFAGLGVIFSFHRVMPTGGRTLNPGYTVSTDVLESYLTMVRQAGWRIVGIDEVEARLAGDGGGDRFACFTFDDGYRDNLTYALPVFKKHEAPMCVYATTGLLDREIFYWWGSLEQLFLQEESVEIDLPNDPAGARHLRLSTTRAKLDALRTVDAWCHANPGIADQYLRPLFRRYGIENDALLERDALGVQELRQMACDPLVTVGSHTVSHRRLTLLSDEEVAFELTASRSRLERELGVEVRHLAYPYGSVNACGVREFDAAKRAGYATAVTTRRGNVFDSHRHQLLSLPRRGSSPAANEVRHAIYGVSAILGHEARPVGR